MSDILNLIADTGALLCFFGMAAFTFLYGVFYRWRLKRAGRSFFFLSIAFLAVSAASYFALWIGPDYWGRPFFRTLAWGFAAFAVGYMIYALLRNWNSREPIEIERKTGEIVLVDSPADPKE